MKKLIIKNIAAAVFTLISFSAIAQTTEKKPAIDESGKITGQDKVPTATPVPQIVTAPKALTIKEQPKPVVPGGEFTPVDTNVPVKNYTKTTAEEKITPVQHPSQKQQ
jgi:hypothetical protein